MSMTKDMFIELTERDDEGWREQRELRRLRMKQHGLTKQEADTLAYIDERIEMLTSRIEFLKFKSRMIYECAHRRSQPPQDEGRRK